MCGFCKKDNCNCNILTGNIKYDGLKFICNVAGIERFKITPGDNFNPILDIIFNQLCSILDGSGLMLDPSSKWISEPNVPDDSIGNNGDMYLDSSTGDIYQKENESWGSVILNIKGIDGTDGTDGSNGNRWTTGNGSPIGTLGSIGDMYLDNTNGNVYQVQNNGQWVLQTNIKGDEGLSFRSGVGVPSSSVGNNGELYVDLASDDLDLYQKSLGLWINTTLNLKGTSGTSFIQGSGSPSNSSGIDGDSYLDNITNDIYLKQNGVWALTGNIATGSNLDTYGFFASKTLDQGLSSGDNIITFENDNIIPNYDNNNDFAVDTYIGPSTVLDQRYMFENISIENNGASNSGPINISIQRNGSNIVSLPTFSLVNGDSTFISSLISPYLTINNGDLINVNVNIGIVLAGNIVVKTGARFSSSIS